MKRWYRGVLVILVLGSIILIYFRNFRTVSTDSNNILPTTMRMSSTDFADGGAIPSRYSCDGDDTSPPLSITGVPNEALTLVLIMDDPDASSGRWDHWLLFNINAHDDSLASLPAGAAIPGTSGLNSWSREGYGGPCPSSGSHRYIFTLYALDVALDLHSGASRRQIEAAMQGHVIAQASLMGRYARGSR